MKTPAQWRETYPDLFEHTIKLIQQDAFESGWRRGMEDAMDMQSKGVDPNRAIDAWRTPPTKTTEK